VSHADVCLESARRIGMGLSFAVLLLGLTPLAAVAQVVDWDPLSIEFGAVPIGSREIRTLTLENIHGSEPLNIESIEFTFNDRGAFGVTAELPAVLGPGEILEVEFSFEPPDFSFFFGDVLITNDSTNAPSLTYQLLGEGSFSSTTTTTTTTTSTMPVNMCGDPVADGGGFTTALVTASDALFTLNASVGLRICELCVCDVNNSGSVTATDALVTLNAAVGLPVSLQCPPCT